MANLNKCENCNLCCVYFSINDPPNPSRNFPGVKKNVMEVCPNHKDGGCIIYNNKGPICNNYRCLWHWGFLPDWLKPDKVGIIFDRFLFSVNKTIYLVGRTGTITPEIETTIKQVCDMGMPVQINVVTDKILGVRKKTLYEPLRHCDKCQAKQKTMQERMQTAARQTGLIVNDEGNFIRRKNAEPSAPAPGLNVQSGSSVQG